MLLSQAHVLLCLVVYISAMCGGLEAYKLSKKAQSTTSPVTISLYFDSMCPGAQDFITRKLYPTWKIFRSTGILKVDLTPYGIAEEKELPNGMWNFTCKHGAKECIGNLIENCLQKYTDYEFDVYFPIIYCMEHSDDPIAAAEKCITDAKQDWVAIKRCSSNEEGNALMHKSALKTDALHPRNCYVPWILVNGKHSENLQDRAQTNLSALLCKVYRGEKPQECKAFLHPHKRAPAKPKRVAHK